MATDSTNLPQGETTLDASIDMTASDLDLTTVQLAQTEPANYVDLPKGNTVILLPVQPGQTVRLPTDSTDGVLAKIGPEGNLALVVDGRTIILQGFLKANDQSPIKIVTSDGDAVNVAELVAATDPSLDIQTAAGPASGDQGDTDGSGIYIPFLAGPGLGGLDALGILDPTALQYRLIDDEYKLFTEEEGEPVTFGITFDILGGIINEDDLPAGDGPGGVSPDQPQLASAKFVLGGKGGHGSGMNGEGNDPFDTTDREDEPGDEDGIDDNGDGVDPDREPLETVATIKANFPGSGAGTLTLDLNNLPTDLKSHGELVSFEFIPGLGAGDQIRGFVDGGGDPTKFDHPADRLVLTVVADTNLSPTGEFNVTFTLWDQIDHAAPDADKNDEPDLLGANEQIFDLPVHFTLSGGGAVGDGKLPLGVQDDIPFFGKVIGCEIPIDIVCKDVEITHDETHGVQPHSDDVSIFNPWVALLGVKLGIQVDKAGFDFPFGESEGSLIGAAKTQVHVSFGADGPAVFIENGADKDARNSIFGELEDRTDADKDGVDDGENEHPFELFLVNDGTEANDGGAITEGDLTIAPQKTNATVTWSGTDPVQVLPVYVQQLDAHTVIGYVQPVEGGDKVAVFALYIDDNGCLSFYQIHQINHDVDGKTFSDHDDPFQILGADGEPLIYVRATDYDGDHAIAPVNLTIEDDGPKFCEVDWGCDGDSKNGKGVIDEEGLKHGIHGGPGDDKGGKHADGKIVFDFGVDEPGHLEIKELTVKDNSGKTVLEICLNPDGSLFVKENCLEAIDGKELSFEKSGPDADGKVTWTAFITDCPGEKVFTFTLDTSGDCVGEFDFCLLKPLEHPDNNGNPYDNNYDNGKGSFEDNFKFDFKVRGYDSDGDYADGNVCLSVDDDSPDACKVEISFCDEDNKLVHDETKGVQTGGDDWNDPDASGQPEDDTWYVKGFEKFEQEEHCLDAIGYAKTELKVDLSGGSNCPTAAFGADGPGRVSPVSIVTSSGGDFCGEKTNLTDTKTGCAIYLFTEEVCGETFIVGRVGGKDGEVSFALTISDCGDLELAQYRAIQHPDGCDSDESIKLLDCEGNALINLQVKVVDADGDAVYARTPVDGCHGNPAIVFQDDGPCVDVCEGGKVVLAMDETDKFQLFPSDYDQPGVPNGPLDGNTTEGDWLSNIAAVLQALFPFPIPDVLGAAKDNVSDLFKVKFGTDGGCVVCYDLTILNDGKTNLVDTESGTCITLVNGPNGIVEGRDGEGNLVFAICLDKDSGEIVSVQFRAIDHGDEEGAPGAHDEVTSLLEGILGVTATAFDKDGDKDSETVDIGCGVIFEDDGPKFEKVDWGNDGDSTTRFNGTGLIDEDALPGGIPGGPGDDAGGKSTDGKVIFDFGADKPGKVEINALEVKDANNIVVLKIALNPDGSLNVITNNLLAINNETLSFEKSAPDANGVVTWSAYINGDPAQKVFTFSIDTCGDNIGEFDFCLLQPLEHPYTDADSKNNGPEKSYEDNFKFDFTIRGYDGDGDSADGHVKLSVDDDSPTVEACEGAKLQLAMDETDRLQFGDYNDPNYPTGPQDGPTPETDLLSLIVNVFDAIFPGPIPHVLSAAKDDASDLFKVNFGADGGCVVCYDLTILCADGKTNLRDTETGDCITLVDCGGGVVKGVTEGGKVVFAIWLDHDSGQIITAQFRAIDHGDEEGAPGAHDEIAFLKDGVLGVTATATDNDGDTVCKTVDVGCGISFEDDGPKFKDVDWGRDSDSKNGKGLIDEDALPGGIPGGPGDDDGGKSADGKVVFDFGVDKPPRVEINALEVKDANNIVVLKIALNPDGSLNVITNNLLAINNEALSFEKSAPDANGVVTWSAYINGDPAQKVFTFSLDTEGAGIGEFDFCLLQPLEHPYTDADSKNNGPEKAYEDNFKFDFTVRGYDGDGDSADGHVVLSVDDDTPCVESCEGAKLHLAMDETDRLQFGDFDQPGVPNGPLDGPTPELDLLSLLVNVFDAIFPGPIPHVLSAAKDNVSDLFKVKFGADGGCEVCYDLTILCDGGKTNLIDTETGTCISLVDCGGGVVKGVDEQGNVVFAIWLDHDSGQVITAQFRAIDHGDEEAAPGAHDEIAFLKDGVLGVTATATDNDGDKACTTVDIGCGISFEDDGPKFKDVDWGRDGDSKSGTGLIDEDALPGGNPGGPGDDDGGKSADGKVVFDFGVDKQPKVEINALEVKDHNGNIVLKITLDALGNPVASPNNLQAINNQALDFAKSAPDANGVVTWTAFVAGHPDQKVFTFSLDTSGADIGEFDFCLLQPLEHPLTDDPSKAGTDKSFEDNFKFDFTIRGYDGDGDSADAHVKLSVDDDSPTVTDCGCETNLLVNGSFEDLGKEDGGTLENGNWGVFSEIPGWKSGASEAAPTGVPGLEIQNNIVLVAKDGKYYVELDSDDIDPGAPHPSTTNASIYQDVETVDGNNYVLSFSYSPREGNPASDGIEVWFDGQLIATINSGTVGQWTEHTFVVKAGEGDATPDLSRLEFKAVGTANELGGLIDDVKLTACAIVDEDALKNGIEGGPGDDAGNACFSGSLGIAFGADGGKSIEFCAEGQPCVTSGGCEVKYEWCGNQDGTGTLIAYTGNDPKAECNWVFTVAVQSLDNGGEYKFTLLQPLDHPAHDADGKNNGPEKSWEDNLVLDLKFKASDNDCDTVEGHLKVNVDDDSPCVESCDSARVQLAMDETDRFQFGDYNDPNYPTGPQDGPTPENDLLSLLINVFDAIFPGPLPHVLSAAKDNVSDLFKVKFGADGGEACYDLAILCGDGKTNLRDTETGDCITLVDCGGGVVKGVTEGGEVVFAIWLDHDSGEIVTAQFRAIDHGGEEGKPGAHDEVALLGEHVLGVTVTVTDNDGDKVCKTVDIGCGISFEDDGPKVDIKDKRNAEIRLDESAGVPAGDEPADGNANDEASSPDPLAIAYKSVAGSGLFTIENADFGADGEGSKAFSLNINDATTNLVDVQTDLAVVLSQSGNTVTGTAGPGGETVFVIVIDPTDGDITVTQYRAVKHDLATDPDEAGPDANNTGPDEPQGMGSGKLSLTLTLTDGDCDAASDSIDLGKLFKFEDDGPIARNDTDHLETSDGGSTFVATGNVYSGIGTDSGNVDDGGTDVPWIISKLSGAGGNDETTADQLIVTGAYGTLTLDPNTGQYTYDFDESKIGSIPEGATDVFTYTLKDKDGDTDTACLTINLPTASVTTSAVVGAQGDAFLKEDVYGPIALTATPGTGDTVTEITLSNIPAGWDVKTAPADIGLSSGTLGTVTFVGGVLTIQVVGAAAGTAITATVQVKADADSDVDGENLTVGATVVDGPLTATGSSNFDVVVDAVLDQYVDVSDSTNTVDGTAGAQTVSLNLLSTLTGSAGDPFTHSFAGGAGADGDGSEDAKVVITVNAEANTAGVNLVLNPGAPAGVTLTEAPAGSGNWELTGNAPDVQTALSFVAAQLPAGFEGSVTGTVHATTYEANTPPTYNQPASGDEPQTGDNIVDDEADYTLTVEDNDIPDAVDDNAPCITESRPNANLLLIFDVSGSMNSATTIPDPEGGFLTKLEAAKVAAIEMLNAYAAAGGDVKVMLVWFNASADREEAWLSVEDAIDAINAIPASSNDALTDYDDAITEAIAAFNDADGRGDPANHPGFVYFLSDGQPTTGGNGGDDGDGLPNYGITPAHLTDWNNLLESDANNVQHVYSVGFGGGIPDGINNQHLVSVANPDNDAPTDPTGTVLFADAIEDLEDTLIDTVSTSQVSGNVLTNDTDGGDGYNVPNPITQFVHDGKTYSLADLAGSEGNTVVSNDGTTLVITTDKGGTLELNFKTGDYTYTAPSADDDFKENFVYTIEDTTGDVDSAALTVCVKDSVPEAFDNLDQALVFQAQGTKTETTVLADFSDTTNEASSGAGYNPWIFDTKDNSPSPSGNESTVEFDSTPKDAADKKWGVDNDGENGFVETSGNDRLHIDDDDDGDAAVATPAFTIAAGTTGELSFVISNESINGDDTGIWQLLKKDGSNVYSIVEQNGSASSNGTIVISNIQPGTYRLYIAVTDDEDGDAELDIDDITLKVTSPIVTTQITAATGNVVTDPMNYIASSDPWGAVDKRGADGAAVRIWNGLAFVDATLGGVLINGVYGDLLIKEDGSYTYTPDAVLGNVGQTETFTYQLRQPDGDLDTASLVIKIGTSAVADPTPTQGNDDGTTLNGDDNANLILGNGGNDTVNGAGGNDHLEGGDGNDIVNGGANNDALLGGAGNDALIGGAGDDVLVGGVGNDAFDLTGGGHDTIRIVSALDGQDIVTGFTATAGAEQDFVDLDTVFDSLGVASGDRAGKVAILDGAGNGATANDTVISVDTDGTAGVSAGDVRIVLIGVVTHTDVTVGTDVIAGTL